jgi:1-acyl-sn-glycerol-3-phosphate acyltransferase
MIRGFLYWVFGGLITFVWGIFIFICHPFLHNRENFIHSNIHLWSKFLLTFLCGVRIEITGEEHIDSQGAYIIVSNHRSYTDILVGGAAMPLQFRWLAKESIFKIPLIGTAMRGAGYISIVREQSMAASKSLEKVVEVLKGGTSVWIFPEGTRTPEERLRNFKRGAFIVAQQTGVPLLPVVLVHTDEIFHRPFIIRGTRVKLIFKKPVYYNVFKKKEAGDREALDRMIRSVRELIQTEYDANVAQSS